MYKECANNRQELMSGMMYLVQDKWDWDWQIGVICQNDNIGDGKDQVQPRKPCGNVWKCGKWDFTIDGYTKEYMVNWIRDSTGRGGRGIPRHKNSIGGTADEKTRSNAPPKKLVWVEGDVSYICCILVGVIWRFFPLYGQVLNIWRILNHSSITEVK